MYIALGIIVITVGLLGMRKLQDIHEKILQNQLKDDRNTHCQSCGRKFTSIVIRGTNNDSSESKSFCSSCYKNGSFVEPDLTIEEFQERCFVEIGKRKSKMEKKRLSNHFKKLERWDKEQFL